MPKNKKTRSRSASPVKSTTRNRTDQNDISQHERDEILKSVQEIFVGKAEPEVVLMVLSECEWRADEAIDTLFSLCGEEKVADQEKANKLFQMASSVLANGDERLTTDSQFVTSIVDNVCQRVHQASESNPGKPSPITVCNLDRDQYMPASQRDLSGSALPNIVKAPDNGCRDSLGEFRGDNSVTDLFQKPVTDVTLETSTQMCLNGCQIPSSHLQVHDNHADTLTTTVPTISQGRQVVASMDKLPCKGSKHSDVPSSQGLDLTKREDCNKHHDDQVFRPVSDDRAMTVSSKSSSQNILSPQAPEFIPRSKYSYIPTTNPVQARQIAPIERSSRAPNLNHFKKSPYFPTPTTVRLSDILKKPSMPHRPQRSQSKPTTNHSNSLKDRIQVYVNNGKKVLVLLRGIPGSGKSTLARQIKFDGVVLTTDDYFMRGHFYEYAQGLLGDAHDWNQQRCENSMKSGITPIIIDNTNLQRWEMKPYISQAIKYCYSVELMEPKTKWKYNARELTKRNTHGVGLESIQRMLQRFEYNVTVEDIRTFGEVPENLSSDSEVRQKLDSKEMIQQSRRANAEVNIDDVGDEMETSVHANETNDEVEACVHRTETSDEVETSVHANETNDKVEACVHATETNDEVETSVHTTETSDEVKACVHATETNDEVETSVHANETNDKVEPCVHATETNDEVEPCVHATETNDELETSVHVAETNDEVEACVHTTETSDEVETSVHVAETNDKVETSLHATETNDKVETSLHATETNDELETSVHATETNDDVEPCVHTNETNDELETSVHATETNVTGDCQASSNHTPATISLTSKAEKAQDHNLWSYNSLQKQSMLEFIETNSKFFHNLSSDERNVLKEIKSKLVDMHNLAELNNVQEEFNALMHFLPSSDFVKNGLQTIVDDWFLQTKIWIRKESRSTQENISLRSLQNNKSSESSEAIWESQEPKPQRKQTNHCENKTIGDTSIKTLAVHIDNQPEKYLKNENISNSNSKPSKKRTRQSKARPTSPLLDSSLRQNMLDNSWKFPQNSFLIPEKDIVGKNNSSKEENESTVVTFKDKMTSTSPRDFNVLHCVNEGFESHAIESYFRILCCKSLGNRIPNSSQTPPKVSTTPLMRDQSTLTDDLPLEMSEKLGLDFLRSCFGEVDFEDLRDIFVSCGNDVEWAVNIILDWGYDSIGQNPKERKKIAMHRLSSSDMSDDNHLLMHSTQSKKTTPPSLMDLCSKSLQTNSVLSLEKQEDLLISEGQKRLDFVEEMTLQTQRSITLEETFTDVCTPSEDTFTDVCTKQVTQLCSNPHKDGENLCIIDKGVKKDRMAIDRTGSKQLHDASSKMEEGESSQIEGEEETTGALIPLLFTPETIQALSALFGPLSDSRRGSRVVEVDYSIAEVLYECLKRTSSLDESHPTKFTPLENTIIKPGKSRAFTTSPISFREIQEEEFAKQQSREEYIKIIEATGDTTAMSTRLKRQKLQDEFPGVDDTMLEEFFESNGFSLEETTKALHYALGNMSPNSILKDKLAEQHENHLINLAKEKSLMELSSAKKKPMIVTSTLKTYQSFEDPDYVDFRAEAITHHQLRQECFQKAQQAYQRGMKDVASFYSRQGHLHTEKLREANFRASNKILEYRNADTSKSSVLDLHGLHPDEAVHHLSYILEQRKQELLKKPSCKELRHLSVITGKGVHSRGGRAKVKPAIIEFLKRSFYSWSDEGSGVVRVKIKT